MDIHGQTLVFPIILVVQVRSYLRRTQQNVITIKKPVQRRKGGVAQVENLLNFPSLISRELLLLLTVSVLSPLNV